MNFIIVTHILINYTSIHRTKLKLQILQNIFMASNSNLFSINEENFDELLQFEFMQPFAPTEGNYQMPKKYNNIILTFLCFIVM